MVILTKLLALRKQEEEYLKLKSRVQWLPDGDDNTRFFHLSTVKRRRRNRISGIQNSVRQWISTITKSTTLLLTTLPTSIQPNSLTLPAHRPPLLFWVSL